MGVLAPEIEATYEVLSKMGEGGMGAVYKVRHRFFDEIRVVKVMQTQLQAVNELKERFLGEAKRGKQLRHPNLAEVIDFSITADGTSYIVMEFIEGVNLRELLARNGGSLDYRTLIPIGEQALDALGYLHSKKFVHRDISPDNLMLTNDGTREPRVKLIDLGIAKSLEANTSLTMAGKFIGKVSYASPEQFSGEVDPRSDIYALGIVLYEALTGAKPVTGKTPMGIIEGHLSRPPRPFDETDPEQRVPPAVRTAVLKALEKRPDDRYQSAAEFAAALRSTLAPGDRRTRAVPMATLPSEFAPTLEESRPAVTSPAAAPATVPAPVTMPATASMVDPTVVTTPPPKPSRRGYVIAALVALAILGGTSPLWLRSRESTVERRPLRPPEQTVAPSTTLGAGSAATAPPSEATVDVPAEAPPVANGELVINALPWGRVISVVDAAGVERLGSASDTPLVLALPAGAYKVRLTNPNSNRSVVLEATVTANARARVEAELDRVDPAEYLSGIGLGD